MEARIISMEFESVRALTTQLMIKKKKLTAQARRYKCKHRGS